MGGTRKRCVCQELSQQRGAPVATISRRVQAGSVRKECMQRNRFMVVVRQQCVAIKVRNHARACSARTQRCYERECTAKRVLQKRGAHGPYDDVNCTNQAEDVRPCRARGGACEAKTRLKRQQKRGGERCAREKSGSVRDIQRSPTRSGVSARVRCFVMASKTALDMSRGAAMVRRKRGYSGSVINLYVHANGKPTISGCTASEPVVKKQNDAGERERHTVQRKHPVMRQRCPVRVTVKERSACRNSEALCVRRKE